MKLNKRTFLSFFMIAMFLGCARAVKTVTHGLFEDWPKEDIVIFGAARARSAASFFGYDNKNL
jgi:hypothetical protein